VDVTRGKFWNYEAAYCSDCYLDLQAGIQHPIDQSRLALRCSQPDEKCDGAGGNPSTSSRPPALV
jgi:hypothetical protein